MSNIHMNDIKDTPRQIATAFADVYIDMRDTVKLASDIQNYALSVLEDYINEQNPSYTKLLSKKPNIILGLEDILANGVFTGEEVDITAEKIYKSFIEPLLRLIEIQKT